MALKPILKQKVDELFLRWLSDQETQHILKKNLQQILKGEPVTYPGPGFPNNANNNVRSHPQSPRLRPGSPSTPPCSPSLASPRSPRTRGLNNRSLFARTVTKDKNVVNSINKEGFPRGEPDGEDNFLRRKKDELREKREGGQRQKGDFEKSEKDSTKSNNKPSVVVNASGDAVLDTKGVKKKDGLIAAALSSLKQSTQQNHVTSQKVKVVPPEEEEVKPKPTPEIKPQPNQQPTPAKSQTVPAKPDPKPTPKSSSQSKGKDIVKSTSNDKSVPVPQFYFPQGQPTKSEDLESTAQKIKDVFGKVEGGKVQKQDMGDLMKACGLPYYWKCPMFNFAGGEKNGHLTLQTFLTAWRKLVTSCHDDASRFLKIMVPQGQTYILDENLLPLIQDVVDTHPGLSFLQDAPEFHSRYIQTVVSRIFYSVNRSWSGRITVNELRRSVLLQTLVLLEDEEDINQVTDFFSYEHFYVIYCKFWELDKDHDLFISKEDLARHNDHALSMRMIERIFSGAVTRNLLEDKMSYKDFVWFLLSEEDKRNPTSMEYWFRCMDLDGDGMISMYEMEYFYEEQVQKMESLGIETLPFEDCLCQMLDMIKPERTISVSLKDLKNCKLTPIFYDTFFNLEKYLEHEQKDPFANIRDQDSDEPEMSDWERYATEEYEILVAEEGTNEEINYEDDFEPDDDLQSPPGIDGEMMRLSDPPRKIGGATSPTDDDIYDFSNKDNLGF